MKYFFLFILIVWGFFQLRAQIEYPQKFLKKLERANLAFYEPVEGRFRSIAISKNEIFKPDFTIESRLNQLEIQYAIHFNKDEHLNRIPHIQGHALALSLASNQANDDIAVAYYSEKLLYDKQLDWAAQFDFIPKQELSNKPFATLIALQRAKSNAIAYLLFFYTEANLDFTHYFDTLQFDTL